MLLAGSQDVLSGPIRRIVCMGTLPALRLISRMQLPLLR